MNREIKFRGKRLSDGKWLYGDVVHTTKEFKPIVEILDWSQIDGENANIQVDPSTVGQFAELKDEKGREIYEGDIVQDEYEGIAKVCFDSYSWNLIYGCGIEGDQVQSFEEAYGLRMAIIGNIYDDPELIK